MLLKVPPLGILSEKKIYRPFVVKDVRTNTVLLRKQGNRLPVINFQWTLRGCKMNWGCEHLDK